MMGRNHRLTTAAVVLGLTGRIIPAAMAFLGSTFPDRVERLLTGLMRVRHRGHSHFWIHYIALLGLCYSYLGKEALPDVIPTDPVRLATYMLLWFLTGCLAHIAEDFVCGGVPLWSSKKPIGVRLFKTGSALETVFALAVSSFALWLRMCENGFTVSP